MADLASLPLLHKASGVSSAGLQPAADWFSGAFRLLSPEEASRKVGPAHLDAGAHARAGCSDGVTCAVAVSALPAGAQVA